MNMHKPPNYVILSVAKDLLRPELRHSKILRSQAPRNDETVRFAIRPEQTRRTRTNSLRVLTSRQDSVILASTQKKAMYFRVPYGQRKQIKYWI